MLISDQLVQKIFMKYFGSFPDSYALHELLHSYEDEGRARVHIAILKLSEGDPAKLRYYIEAA